MGQQHVANLGVWEPFDIVTFETGSAFKASMECASTTLASSNFETSPAPPFGPQTTVMHFPQKKFGFNYITAGQDLSSDNTNIIFSGYVYLDDPVWPPTNNVEFDLVTINDVSGGTCMQLRLIVLTGTVTLQLLDETNSVIASTTSTGFSNNSWIRIEIYCQLLDSGDCVVKINGVEKFLLV